MGRPPTPNPLSASRHGSSSRPFQRICLSAGPTEGWSPTRLAGKNLRKGKPRDGAGASVIVLTSLAWAILAVAVGWVFIAVGWWLLGYLWRREVLVPVAVADTVTAFALVVTWAIVLLILAVAWRRHNRLTYNQRERRVLGFFDDSGVGSGASPAWREMVFSDPLALLGQPLRHALTKSDGCTLAPAGHLLTAELVREAMGRGLYAELMEAISAHETVAFEKGSDSDR